MINGQMRLSLWNMWYKNPLDFGFNMNCFHFVKSKRKSNVIFEAFFNFTICRWTNTIFSSNQKFR